MSRMLSLACALGLWLPAAAAQELELRAPQMTARQCTPHQRNVCQGLEERALGRALACDACESPAATMPAELTAPIRSQPPVECAMTLMPLGPPAPGCTPLPVDSVPRP